MKILFLTLLDFTSIEESGIYTDLMTEFVKENHKLYIVSPTEKRFQKPTSIIENKNYKILKLQIGNTQKTNLVEKAISTLTLESKFKQGIKKYFSDTKFDLVIYSTPPITLQKAVEYVKNRDGAKSYLLLKDIFPQNAIDLKMFKEKSIIAKFFKKKEEKLYAQSDFIGCMSEANVNYILKNNPQLDKKTIEICPNSINPVEVDLDNKEIKQIRQKWKIPFDKTVFLYGGNLGKPQGIDFLIDCIRANLNNEKAYFLIIGAGTEFNKLETFFQQECPINAQLLSHLPKEDYEVIANSCDVGLIFLDNKFTIPNFPSRILSYMQASMPVLAATDINTDIGKVVEYGEFGYWCESSQVDEFTSLVTKLCNNELRIEMGKNARAYLESHYTARHSYEIIMKHFQK